MYITVEEAEDYFEGRYNSDAWYDATPQDKEKSLITAGRAIDRLNFAGELTDSDQEHQFPRGGDEEVPQDILDAVCELAYAYLDGVEPEIEYENLGMVAQGFGNVRSTYDRSVYPAHIVAGIVSIAAWRFLLPYLRDPLTLDMTRVS